MIDNMTFCTVIALEVRQDDMVDKLRALVGPQDPEIAQN